MLYGVIITLPDGSQILGVIFPDDKIYAHEPICDLWATKEDFLTSNPGHTVELVGPVIALDLARKQLTEQYEENKRNLDRDYKNCLRMYATLDTSVLPIQGAD